LAWSDWAISPIAARRDQTWIRVEEVVSNPAELPTGRHTNREKRERETQREPRKPQEKQESQTQGGRQERDEEIQAGHSKFCCLLLGASPKLVETRTNSLEHLKETNCA
jgi:hypothetical protein